MPLVDMPLAELVNYQGCNPKPSDFESFWDTSIAEMRALTGDVTLVPVSTACKGAEMFELWFTGVGGARVFAKYLRPKGAKNCPAVVQFHGYTANSGDWSDKLNWVANGFAVAALDCRGQGGRSEDVGGVKGNTHNGHIIRGLAEGPEKLLFRSIFLDCAQLARIVMNFDEVDSTRVGATGGSQGGGLTVACAALEPNIKRAVPVFPFLSDYKRVWDMDLDVGAYAELRTYLRYYDPRHENIDEVWQKLGYIDIQHLAPRIKAEILMALGLVDTITPPSTCFAAYNKITSKKDVKIYPDFGHEGLPGFNDLTYEFLSGM